MKEEQLQGERFPVIRRAGCCLVAGHGTLTATWASHRTVAVEACSDLTGAVWSEVGMLTLGEDGTAEFIDPSPAVNQPARFYRLSGR